jgi:phosphoserine phosphatase
MILINVIDLDNTLIPYDTLRKYILLKIRKGDLHILVCTLFRKIRIINTSKYSELVFKSVAACDEDFLNRFIKEQYANIDFGVLNIVKKHCPANQETINIVCSASPSNYVKPIAELIGCIGIGSEYRYGEYFHMYGNKKKYTILQRFPKDEYLYNFAISDSLSDMDLMLCFNEYLLYSKK